MRQKWLVALTAVLPILLGILIAVWLIYNDLVFTGLKVIFAFLSVLVLALSVYIISIAFRLVLLAVQKKYK